MAEKKLLTPKDVAAQLGVDESTVYRFLVPRGDLACVRWSNTKKARIRVRQIDLDAWVERHRQEATPSLEQMDVAKLPGASLFRTQ